MKYVKTQRVALQNACLDEKWVQRLIAEDPSVLGLGDVVVRDKERKQPQAGRLDLLLEDPETSRRYEVEIQLDKTDESHIIRTIEYWDIERKRYPQYDHCAVIVAEDITSRFLNVLSLFNGSIPLIAIQMSAHKIDEENVTVVFTHVLDELTRGWVDEDEDVYEPTDRSYWEKRGTKETVAFVDELLKMVRALGPGLVLKYNKHYIGLAKDGVANNFVTFRPKKRYVIFEPRLKESEEINGMLESAGMDVLAYDNRWGRYRVQIEPTHLASQGHVLQDLLKRAHDLARD